MTALISDGTYHDSDRLKQRRGLGTGVWLDPHWSRDIDNGYHDKPGDPKLDFVGWSGTDLSRNYWQPDEIQMALTNALEHTDKYVWLYTERTWYWGERKTLSPEYETAIRNARGCWTYKLSLLPIALLSFEPGEGIDDGQAVVCVLHILRCRSNIVGG